jgi:hypothetical protein
MSLPPTAGVSGAAAAAVAPAVGLERGASAMSGAAGVIAAAQRGGVAAATHHTAGGAVAAAPAPAGAPDDPEDLVGLRVKRLFVEGEFGGTVVSSRISEKHGPLWRVCLADGDEEELNWAEMRAALVDAWRPPTAALKAEATTARAEPSHAAGNGGARAPQALPRASASAPAAAPAAAAAPPPPRAPTAQRDKSAGSSGSGRGDAALAASGDANAAALPKPAADAAPVKPPLRVKPPQASPQVPSVAARAGASAAPLMLSPPEKRYFGVHHTGKITPWVAKINDPQTKKIRRVLSSQDPVECARAYDVAARKLGLKTVNFPRPGTDEVQAVYGMYKSRALPPPSLPAPPAPPAGALPGVAGERYKGVYRNHSSSTAWKAVICEPGGLNRVLLTSNDAVACAHAYDAAARKRHLKVVNFPRPGTDEVQAVFQPRQRDRTNPAKPQAEWAQKPASARRSFAATEAAAADFYGVSAIGSRFQAKLGATSLGLHDSAKAAALAVDAHARATRFLGALNFPANDAERAAVDAARPLPPPDSSDEEGDSQDGDDDAAAAADEDEGGVAADEADDEEQAPPQAMLQKPKRAREPSEEAPPRRAPGVRAAAREAAQAAPTAAAVGAAAHGIGGGDDVLALMRPAAVALVAAPAGEDATTAGVAAFLRSIRPPLSQLDAALAALPGSGLSMEHLAAMAATEAAADRQMLYAGVAGELSLTRMADRVAFVAAVSALTPRGAGRGGMGLLG